MAFTLSKVSDYGTATPVVARTTVQVMQVLDVYGLGKEEKERIYSIYIELVRPKLIRCMEIVNKLDAAIEKINADIQKNGPKTQSHGRVVELPHIEQLKEDVESYLYNAKSALRDIALILEPILGKRFNNSRYDKILTWSEESFGKESNLSKMLTNDQEWIKEIISKRNAVEHPGEYSGTLHVDNYKLVTVNNDTHQQCIIEPTWHRDGEEPSFIVSDLTTVFHNLLEFSEAILMASLQQRGSPFPVVIYEIPEQERDAHCPVRLRASIDIEALKNRSKDIPENDDC